MERLWLRQVRTDVCVYFKRFFYINGFKLCVVPDIIFAAARGCCLVLRWLDEERLASVRTNNGVGRVVKTQRSRREELKQMAQLSEGQGVVQPHRRETRLWSPHSKSRVMTRHSSLLSLER